MVFATGVLPATEAARLHLIGGVGPALDGLGMGLDETVDLIAAGRLSRTDQLLSVRSDGERPFRW
ncbi:hypothetical protein [Planobispora takensis]|uniref:Uncharacterized protein n=1 Tax=Planobispora takensis TaxID=1367882 RepID=A0A8J3WXS0_9ACTN|nr:hypothetical protein Pta02_75680 [Planobispora takensis]